MTDVSVAVQVISVFLIISFGAGKLIVNAARLSTARYYSLGYFIIVILYINIIGALNNFFERNWLNKEHKQGLIFLAALYTLCVALSFVVVLIGFYLRRGRA